MRDEVARREGQGLQDKGGLGRKEISRVFGEQVLG